MKIRNASRLILVDELNRVLLFKIKDPYNPELDEFWVTPGGGLDPEESFEAAALRELWEETGIQDVELGPWVWTREARFKWEAEIIQAYERYFVARVSKPLVTLDHFTSIEQACYRNHKWWSLAELEQTSEFIIPIQLATYLRQLLLGSLPTEPQMID